MIGRAADTSRNRAALLLGVLGLALVIALAPFATGLIAIPVLYVILEPLFHRLSRHLSPRLAAGLTTAIALLLLVTPFVIGAAMILGQASVMAERLATAAQSARWQTLVIGPWNVGVALSRLGTSAFDWLGGSALGLVGTATRQVLNILVALFGLYYLLLRPDDVWSAISAHLPFSAATVERLRLRFRGVTTSTVIGTGLAAALQGVLVGAAFWAAGIPHVVFWVLVTVVLAILPVVGSGMVWGGAAILLLIDGRVAVAAGLVIWGLLVVSNVDFVILPSISRRWAHVHPLTMLIGALAGVPYFGLLGLLIGPLALSYFFELINAYRLEYAAENPPAGAAPQVLPVGAEISAAVPGEQ